MKVKVTIIFETEYNMELDFYDTDNEEEALGIERACVAKDPVGLMDAFEAKGRGTFTTKVERVYGSEKE